MNLMLAHKDSTCMYIFRLLKVVKLREVIYYHLGRVHGCMEKPIKKLMYAMLNFIQEKRGQL